MVTVYKNIFKFQTVLGWLPKFLQNWLLIGFLVFTKSSDL